MAFTVLGLMCIPIGLLYGELTAMFPQTGGSFVYIKKAFSKETTYWLSWALMLSYTTVLAFQLRAMMSIIEYMWWPDMTLVAAIAIAAVLATLVFIVNTRNVSIGTTVQLVLFATLAIVGFTYSIMFFMSPQFTTSNWEPFFQMGTNGFLTAVALMVTMFFGFEVIPQMAEETNYPAKKHWKLMVGAIAFVMLFDGAITLSESGMVPFDVAINTPMLGAEMALGAYGPWLQYAIVIANFAALSACLVGFWMGGSRVLYAMGKSGALPRIFARTNKNQVPSVANWFVYGVVLMFILLSGTAWLASLFTLMAVGVGLTYLGVSASFIKLRIKRKDIERPWKVPGGVVTGVLGLIAAGVISYFTFAYFTEDVWILFILYFAIVGVVRVALGYDQKKHPEKYIREGLAPAVPVSSTEGGVTTTPGGNAP